MASVSHDANGTRRVLFTDGDGVRRSIRLGKMPAKSAASFALRVEALLALKRSGDPFGEELGAWVRDRPDRVHARLARAGLVKPRTIASVLTLGDLLARYEAAAVVKASTIAARKQTTKSLRAHLGEATPLDTLTPADADRWRKAIAGEGLAGATVAKRVHVAKAVFRKAVKWGLIASSPFEDLKAGSQANPERAHYVTPATIAAVLDKCPDDQWRAIITLSRYAGLRCPSEIVGLRWGDVNWDRGRLTVRSPKTAGHGEAHAVRVVPIAPELRPILMRLFEQAEPGAESVVPRLNDATMNLRTTFYKIIARAGEKPWPRLFHNLRASCATDWVERFPAHVVAGWLGHSPLIAAQHYLQTRDAHFDLAAGVFQGGAKSDESVERNASQHEAARTCTGSADKPQTVLVSGVLQNDTKSCDLVLQDEMGEVGLEPTTSRV